MSLKDEDKLRHIFSNPPVLLFINKSSPTKNRKKHSTTKYLLQNKTIFKTFISKIHILKYLISKSFKILKINGIILKIRSPLHRLPCVT